MLPLTALHQHRSSLAPDDPLVHRLLHSACEASGGRSGAAGLCLLEAASNKGRPASFPSDGGSTMTVGEVCKRNVAVAEKSETVVDAANHMRALHVGDLVVIEDRQGRRVPIGILTDRDIVVSAVAENSGHITSLLVGDIMSSDIVSAREHEPVEAALKKMEEHGVRRLPVVDGNGALVGILTLDDALQFLTEEQVGLVKIVVQEQRRERRLRV
jgi:CBS domain-containing protein